jgi:hypothetical protein
MIYTGSIFFIRDSCFVVYVASRTLFILDLMATVETFSVVVGEAEGHRGWGGGGDFIIERGEGGVREGGKGGQHDEGDEGGRGGEGGEGGEGDEGGEGGEGGADGNVGEFGKGGEVGEVGEGGEGSEGSESCK